MNVETITSRQNPLMTHLRKLASSRSYRKKSGEYLVFGISKKPIWLTEKYFEQTGDRGIFDELFVKTVKIILDVFGLNMERVLCKIIGLIISAIIGTIVLIVIYSILYYIIGRDLCILVLHFLFGGYCSLFE